MVCGNQGYMHVFGVCVYCKLSFVSFTTLSTSHASSPSQPALPHLHTFPSQPLIFDPICLLLICGCVLCVYHNEALFDVMFMECPSSLQDGWSSLILACLEGHAEVVRMLLSAGAQVNDQAKVSNSSPAQ